LPQAIALALIAGYADAAGFLRFGAFAGMMTGNTVLMGVAAANRHWGEAASFGALIATFFVAVILAQVFQHRFKRIRYALILEAALLIGCDLIKADWGVVLIVFAMGMQNAITTRVVGMRINTTFVTGVLHQFGEGVARLCLPARLRPDGAQAGPVAIYGLVWASYAVGAAAGAVGYAELPWPLIIPALLLIYVYATARTR
jgi:uncharacterized membrane protein YoaK (UPF0700 family)